MIRVLVVDDHPLFRRGVVTLVGESGLVVAAEADDGLVALRLAGSVAWDVAVIDVSLPRLSGPELLKRLREQYPERKVVVLSQYPAEQMAERLRREGAAAYVWKAGPPEDLITAIRAAAAGGQWPPGPVGEAPAQLPHDRLSAREYQIFTLVHQGRTVSEVAAELNLAMPTVSTHLKRIREKLGARTVAEITAYAHRAGLAT